MFSRFFIERPIFANVIADRDDAHRRRRALRAADRAVSRRSRRRPSRSPRSTPAPTPRSLSDTVASPIEQEVNGVEGMLYMSSTCASDGSYNLTVTFEVGTEPRHGPGARAEPGGDRRCRKLPEEVQRQGVTTKKQSTNIILVVALTSPDGRYDSLFLSNYATLRVKDELSRIYGVGDVNVFGSSNYGMRIWLDPEKLKARNLTTAGRADGDPRAERPGRRRAGRPAARRRRTRSSSTPSRTLGRLERPRAVRRHHRQDRARRRRDGTGAPG